MKKIIFFGIFLRFSLNFVFWSARLLEIFLLDLSYLLHYKPLPNKARSVLILLAFSKKKFGHNKLIEHITSEILAQIGLWYTIWRRKLCRYFKNRTLNSNWGDLLFPMAIIANYPSFIWVWNYRSVSTCSRYV